MNAREGLERIRERLIQNDAKPDTVQLIDTMIVRASTHESERAQASQGQLIRMLMRTPAATNNFTIYNDLVRLEEEVQTVAAQRAAEAEAEANRPLPKSKKFYREQKAKEQRRG
jgi:hypothetical protein